MGDRERMTTDDATGPNRGRSPGSHPPDSLQRTTILEALLANTEEWAIVEERGELIAVKGGQVDLDRSRAGQGHLRAWLPSTRAPSLGNSAFLKAHRVDLPYVAGAMANGIASVELVNALARAGFLAFFGAAGLTIEKVSAAIDLLKDRLHDLSHGFNLIHSPNEPLHELELANLYIARGVKKIEASAYLDITEALVKYRATGLSQASSGETTIGHQVMAKVSRLEVARKFLSPAPAELLDQLLRRGEITPEQARLARDVPLCDDLTAEADSGGHTDNRPALTLLPALTRLRDELQDPRSSRRPIAVGAAGGISTPFSAAAAFALGADYILVGSVHQACIESGSSDVVRKLLSEADPADVVMAPAADMFEMGVKVQVLRRGTLFAPRAQRLYEIYRNFESIEELPAAFLQQLERDYFRAPVEQIWEETRAFFLEKDPIQIERAQSDGKHRMALLFRWYLGQSSKWANDGVESRTVDYQVWCSPAMGAFNEWVRGSIFEDPRQRKIVDVARAIINGAHLVSRSQILRNQGVAVDSKALAAALSPDALLNFPTRAEKMRTGR